ncbi:uroporphyrinogen decarboxylase [bacterium]|nr:uroporphyrinogen decarboxylase [bacterium]
MKKAHTTFVSFESRMALAVTRDMEKRGVTIISAPTLKEVPLTHNKAVFDFYTNLCKGEFDITILLTGVATRTLVETLETKFDHNSIIETLKTKTKIVVRGPKPTAVCKRWDIPIYLTAPEPNTWRDVIHILKNNNAINNKKIALLEYGESNQELIDELTKNGATVTPVKAYAWDLPDDLTPLKNAITSIAAGDVDVALFTSASQVVHLLKVAKDMGLEMPLRKAFYNIAIGSIGPVASETLAKNQLFADFEVFPNKLNTLLEKAVADGPALALEKQSRQAKRYARAELASSVAGPEESLLMNALHLKTTPTIPVWLMRQAGRYMAEYQGIRSGLNFKDFCKNTDKTITATLDAADRLGVDAAIIFSDILLILEPMGLELDYLESKGPVIANPIRDQMDVDRLKTVNTKTSMPWLLESIRDTKKALKPYIPLLGFCGAPFTMASYMIEGGSSKQFIKTKKLMHNSPKLWHQLMEFLVINHIGYLKAQIEAGADAVQIFDSWAGQLTPEDYREYVLPHSRELIASLPPATPVIHFGSFTQAMLSDVVKAGGTCISLDWRINLAEALKIIPQSFSIQGNLDPVLLFSKPEVFLKETARILQTVQGRPGFIFNLGHGILPETPVDHVMALVDYVHQWGKQ